MKHTLLRLAATCCIWEDANLNTSGRPLSFPSRKTQPMGMENNGNGSEKINTGCLGMATSAVRNAQYEPNQPEASKEGSIQLTLAPHPESFLHSFKTGLLPSAPLPLPQTGADSRFSDELKGIDGVDGRGGGAVRCRKTAKVQACSVPQPFLSDGRCDVDIREALNDTWEQERGTVLVWRKGRELGIQAFLTHFDADFPFSAKRNPTLLRGRSS